MSNLSETRGHFRFRLATLLLVVFALSAVLAIGVQFPQWILKLAPYFPSLVLAAVVAFTTNSRALFAAGVVGSVLGVFFNPYGVVHVSWTPQATWWDRYLFYFTIDCQAALVGAILLMVIAAVVLYRFQLGLSQQ